VVLTPRQLRYGFVPRCFEDVAAAEGIAERSVSRVAAGSLLVPDIVEHVVSRTPADHLSVKSRFGMTRT
jgi:hypothetical protein